MNRATKFIIGLLSVIVILQVTWFISLIVDIPYISTNIQRIVPLETNTTQVIALILSIGTLLFALCGISLVALSRTVEKDLTFNNSDGQMTVSKQAIESMINRSASENPDLGNIDSSVKLQSNGKQAHVKVKAVAINDKDYRTTAQALQKNVNDSISKYLGIKSKTKVHIIPRSDSSQNLKVD